MANNGNGKVEIAHNFRASEEFTEWLSFGVNALGRSKSDIIRCCILLSLPTICANPSLIDHVRLDDTHRLIRCQ
jgi:hypothetical protein